MVRKLVISLAVVVLFGFVPLQSEAVAYRFVTIGSGGVTGVYYPAGSAICWLLNRDREKYDLRCTVESTNGSVFNLNAIAAGEIDIGIIQSDWQYHAYHGTSQFASRGANKELRSIFSLHPEPFTVVARADSGIVDFADLKGKRVNIGNPGSGQRGTMEVVMAALGWTIDDFALAAELDSTEQSKALCDNKVDAMVFTVGHPSGSIKEVTTSCETILVNVSGPDIDKLVADNDYYRFATIPGGMYRGSATEIQTFGVGATVVTSSKVSEDVIYQLVKAVFENFIDLQKRQPAFNSLKKEEMVKSGLSAPLHRGAIKYYNELGLL